jgi:ParB family chromosome partitioning protein
MAKRKRLTLPPSAAETPQTTPPGRSLEIKAMFPSYPDGVARTTSPESRAMVAARQAPIAQVAGEAAAQSALDELADEMRAIRTGGRLVTALALSAISDDHMVRDRMVNDPEDMAALKASLIARGQQTPIEVVDLGQGRYGLISGWRRLHAFRALYSETRDARFLQIQALIKPIDSVSDGYVAMVEENEIRANLSFYERARLAHEAARLRVYPTPARAISILFANATSAKRSKIGSFVKLHEAFGTILRFPAAIPERLGLALVKAMERDPAIVPRLKAALHATPPRTAEAERATLDRALRKASVPNTPTEVIPGVTLDARKGRVVLSGKGVTEALQRDLKAWLAGR